MSKEAQQGTAWGDFHRRFIEGRGALMAVLTTVAISVGSLVEIVPMFSATLGPEQSADITPYTPLEVAGRDLYIREGCVTCHSQMIRPMRSEMLRYGEWTRAYEYTYDRPFLLGSRRLGPDLQRVGGKYPDAWHYEHMRDPRSTSPGSIMPVYSWLLEWKVEPEDVRASVVALSKVGHHYDDTSLDGVTRSIQTQGQGIVQNLSGAGITASWDDEIIAMIAYLQRLGVDGNRKFAEEGTGR